jgi:alpha-ribazole phosphatase
MTTRFWLIRHGEPDAEVRHRCYGTLDPPLSHKGIIQITNAARFLASEPIKAVYTSPRRRTGESARIVASWHKCSVEEIADFREIDFGDFEGLTYDEIAIRYPAIYRQWMKAPTEVQFPNGECFSEMRDRVLRAFDRIRQDREGQTVAIIGHAGVIRVLIASALQMPDHCLFRLGQDYGATNLLAWIDDIPCLELLNAKKGGDSDES